jgi:hypothetical protein
MILELQNTTVSITLKPNVKFKISFLGGYYIDMSKGFELKILESSTSILIPIREISWKQNYKINGFTGFRVGLK